MLLVDLTRHGRLATRLCLIIVLPLSACGPTVTTVADQASDNQSRLTWTLPRTTVRVDAGFLLKSCRNKPGGGVDLGVDIVSASATAVPIPDPKTKRSIRLPDLQSWLASNTFNVTLYDDGVLKTFSAKSEDQTGPILIGVLKIAMAVAASGQQPQALSSPPKGRCGAAGAGADRLASASRNVTSQANASRLAAMKAALTLTHSIILDPATTAPGLGEKPFTDTKHPDLPESGIQPSLAEMIRAGWLSADSTPVSVPGVFVSSSRDTVRVDEDRVVPVSPAVDEASLDATFHYRDPAIMEVVLRDSRKNELDRRTMAFGQFGVPKQIPIHAGLFETWDTKFVFAEDGRLTEVQASTTARGLAATNVGAEAASTAAALSAASSTNTAANRVQVYNKTQSDLYNSYSDCLKSGSPSCKAPPQ